MCIDIYVIFIYLFIEEPERLVVCFRFFSHFPRESDKGTVDRSRCIYILVFKK